MIHRIETTLKVSTVLLAVAGALLWLLPPRVPPASALLPSPVSRPTQSASAATPTSDPSSVAAMVASNIFSPSRSAPHSRYTPPGPGSGEPAPSGGEQVMSASLLSPPPLVFGTMIGPGGASALMMGDSAGAGGRLYREGDRVGAYRIVRISGSSVIVAGPGGRVELKVQPREDRTK